MFVRLAHRRVPFHAGVRGVGFGLRWRAVLRMAVGLRMTAGPSVGRGVDPLLRRGVRLSMVVSGVRVRRS